MERTLSDTQHRLSVKVNELHAAHEQIENLERRFGESSASPWSSASVVSAKTAQPFAEIFFSSSNFIPLPAELSQHSIEHKEEVAALQKSLSTLDREKDVLQDDVDQKTEKLVVLQEELAKKVAVATNLTTITAFCDRTGSRL